MLMRALLRPGPLERRVPTTTAVTSQVAATGPTRLPQRPGCWKPKCKVKIKPDLCCNNGENYPSNKFGWGDCYRISASNLYY